MIDYRQYDFSLFDDMRFTVISTYDPIDGYGFDVCGAGQRETEWLRDDLNHARARLAATAMFNDVTHINDAARNLVEELRLKLHSATAQAD